MVFPASRFTFFLNIFYHRYDGLSNGGVVVLRKLGSIERGVQFIYLLDDIKLTLAEKQGLIALETSVAAIERNKTGASFHGAVWCQ